MAEFPPIHTIEDYDRALARLWEVFDAAAGTPEADECDALADLVAAYDDRHYPIPEPSLSDLIQGRMDALGLTEDDLIPHIGSREKVAEMLTGQREVTPELAAALRHFGVAMTDRLPTGQIFPTTIPALLDLEQQLIDKAMRVLDEEKV